MAIVLIGDIARSGFLCPVESFRSAYWSHGDNKLGISVQYCVLKKNYLELLWNLMCYDNDFVSNRSYETIERHGRGAR